MTPDQHNKYLGMAHCAYAGLHALMCIFFGVMMFVMFSTMPSSPRNEPPPPGLFVIMSIFILVFSIGWVVPSMIAGYALLKRKKWAKTASIVAAIPAAAQLPVGTAVAVYTFWFVFGEVGRSIYEPRPTPSLPNPRPDSVYVGQEKQEEFPPLAPPDWR